MYIIIFKNYSLSCFLYLGRQRIVFIFSLHNRKFLSNKDISVAMYANILSMCTHMYKYTYTYIEIHLYMCISKLKPVDNLFTHIYNIYTNIYTYTDILINILDIN